MQSNAFGEALQALDMLKAQGKLRFYGVATEVPEDAPFCLSAPGISSVQLGFGLLDLSGSTSKWRHCSHDRAPGHKVGSEFTGQTHVKDRRSLVDEQDVCGREHVAELVTGHRRQEFHM